MKLDEATIQLIISEYKDGASLYQLAKKYNTHATTISRMLEKNNIELRHDTMKTGLHTAKNGEKLIEWAKAQNRLVTKDELAKVLGKTRLPHAYFIKYPELSQYVQPCERKEWKTYIDQLYDWLNKNNISYKPNDKVALSGYTVQALLLGEYSNIAIQIDIKPPTVGMPHYRKTLNEKLKKAQEKNINILLLSEKHFDNLDNLKELLDTLKKTKEK